MITLMIGTTELLLVAGLALLLFGGKKLPEMMKGMGQGVRSFKEGMNAPLEDPDKARAEQPEGEQPQAQAQASQDEPQAPAQ